MKIQNDPAARLRDMLNRLEEPERSNSGRAARTGTTGATGGSDEVRLSPQALEMQKLRDAVLGAPDVRQDVVDQVRDEIASGRYRIDGTRIADELLKEDLPV